MEKEAATWQLKPHELQIEVCFIVVLLFVFCFGCSMKHEGSQLPYQGWNLHLQQWKHRLFNHQIAREVPRQRFLKLVFIVTCSVNSQSLLTFVFQAYVQKYVVKNYFYYYLFRFSAALGQEVFYITFLPFTHWNIDPYLSRRLIIIWVVSINITYGPVLFLQQSSALVFEYSAYLLFFKKSLRTEFLPGLLWENERKKILKLCVSKTRRGER